MSFSEKIISLIKENSEKAKDVTLTTNIQTDIQIDSLDFMMIINAIEDEFNITIKDTELKGYETISQLVDRLIVLFPGIENE